VSLRSLVDEPRQLAAPPLPAAWPAVLSALFFGLRLWASACLALYLAFALELENAAWAGTTAALVCQPHLGASLRKGRFRLIGTVVGALAVVALTICFPQDRAPFLIGLALWGATCAFTATLLRNFTAYGAAVAAYTAAIIASDILGSTGGPDARVFELAVARASEIGLGIACAGIVLGLTDLGGARRRLAALLDGLVSQILRSFVAGLQPTATGLAETRPVRREFVRQAAALDPVMDEVIGETSGLRHTTALPAMIMGGLFAMLASWRIVATHLAGLGDAAARREADGLLRAIPVALRAAIHRGAPGQWSDRPAQALQLSDAAARALRAAPADTPSRRLVLDRTAELLDGLARVMAGLALLNGDLSRPPAPHHRAARAVPDWLPAFHNAGRAFIAMATGIAFWIISAWPEGTAAVIWAMVPVIMLGPLVDRAYGNAVDFLAGTVIAVVLGGVTAFVLLPRMESFVGFAVSLGLVLVPIGALMARPWRFAPLFAGAAACFVPAIAPGNQMTYDAAQFFNGAIAIVLGIAFGALWLRLLPPMPPAHRARRLLNLTARDLRRLAADPRQWTAEAWHGLVAARLAVLPDEAAPEQRGRLLAAMALGVELIRLQDLASLPGFASGLQALRKGLAQGDAGAASAAITGLDRTLAARMADAPDASDLLRVRGSVTVVAEALAAHPAHVDMEAPR